MKLLLLILVTLLINGCISIKHNGQSILKKDRGNNLISLSNQGSICIIKSNNELLIKYYPLSQSCISSSLYNWKLNGFDITQKKYTIKINSYSLYKFNNSKIYTQDCAGAKIVTKKITLNNNYSSIYWGSNKLINSANIINGTNCYKSIGNSIIHTKVIK